MRSYSPSIEKLCTRWECSIPELAIIKAVETSFPELQNSYGPIDVAGLARRRRATIVPGETGFDGVISRTATGNYIIRLNERHSEQRKRFTIAHEIGHTFFFDLEEPSNVRYRLEDSSVEGINPNWEEEYMCNVAAAEIIMPFIAFSNAMQALYPVAETIVKLSQHFKTSLHATARRFVQLCPYKIIVCLWQRVKESNLYETLWIASRGITGRVSVHAPPRNYILTPSCASAKDA